MHTEIYLDDVPYRALVEHLTAILRRGRLSIYNPRPMEPADFQMSLHAALRLGGAPMGELTMGELGIMPSKRRELVDALVALEPDLITGWYGEDQVRYVLGEAGNVWPARLRKHAGEESYHLAS